MSRLQIITAVAGIVVFGVIIRWVLVTSDRTDTKAPVVETPIPSPDVMPSSNHREYYDASGFRFRYPEDVTISEEDIDPETEYADLTVHSKRASGSVGLRVTDSDYETLEDWRAEIADRLAVTDSVDTMLLELEALELDTVEGRKVAALDHGALFVLEERTINGNPAYWDTVLDTLKTSLAFYYPEPEPTVAPAVPAGSGSEVIFLGEEIIQ